MLQRKAVSSLGMWAGLIVDFINQQFESKINAQLGMFLIDFILYIPVNHFSVMSGLVFLGLTSTKQRIKCLAQGYNAVAPVRLEPATVYVNLFAYRMFY